MKIKKIASLMLAGVMAVSMLAGCSTANVEPEQPENPETPASSAAVDTLYSELTGSAKVMVTPVANSELDNALRDVVNKYWDYNSGADYGILGNGFNKIGYDYLTDVRGGRIGDALKSAVKANYNDISDEKGFSDAYDSNDRTVVEVYAIAASTSDEYALELLAEKIDPYVSNLPTEGYDDKTGSWTTEWDGKANYDYSYTISASVTTKTVTFAGVEQGIKYVAVMLNKTATEKA